MFVFFLGMTVDVGLCFFFGCVWMLFKEEKRERNRNSHLVFAFGSALCFSIYGKHIRLELVFSG